MDKLSYALGLSMGNNFQRSGIKELNVDEFAKAIKAVYEGTEPEMSYEDAKKIVNDFFVKLEEETKDKNKKVGEDFLAENAKKEGIKITPSGLQYRVLKDGNDVHPTAEDQVTVHYTGKLVTGEVFDSSVERGEPATFGVSQVIPGWVEALQLMTEGAKWELFIPSDLAYGPHGAGPMIGPDTTLIFEVELMKVMKK